MRKRRIIVLVSLIVLIIGISALIAISSSGSEPDPELEIKAFNLCFKDSVYIKYAVSVSNAENVSLLVWTDAQSEFTAGTGTTQIEGETCQVFTFSQLAARQMADNVYARAYVEKGGKAYYSDVEKYSVLQYAYNKLGKTGIASDNDKLKNLLTGMLEYGALAQIYTDYKPDRLANDDFYQIKTVGGTITADGFDSGLYLEGEQVEITAPAKDENDVAFNHWENGSGQNVGTSATMTVTVGKANATYTACYTESTQAAGPHLVCDNASVANGSIVTLSVELADCADGIDAMAISISGASDYFTATKGSWSSDYDYEISNFNKTKFQGVARLSDQTEVDGEVFDLTLKPLDGTASGTYKITISLKITYFDSNEDEIEIPCQPVEVTITVN